MKMRNVCILPYFPSVPALVSFPAMVHPLFSFTTPMATSQRQVAVQQLLPLEGLANGMRIFDT